MIQCSESKEDLILIKKVFLKIKLNIIITKQLIRAVKILNRQIHSRMKLI